MKYKKKPVEIEAIQYTGTNNDELKEFVGKQLGFFNLYPVIKTLEGNMTVSINDYVIKGVKGEFYPCKSDIFLATYEPVVK